MYPILFGRTFFLGRKLHVVSVQLVKDLLIAAHGTQFGILKIKQYGIIETFPVKHYGAVIQTGHLSVEIRILISVSGHDRYNMSQNGIRQTTVKADDSGYIGLGF